MRTTLSVVSCMLLLLCSCRPEKDPADAVLQLREMSQLATVEYSITKIIKASDDQTWYKLGERRILMSCRATVKAGIDLSQLQPSDISISDGQISLRLPHAKILSLNIRPEDIRTEFQEVGIFRSDFTAAERNALMAQGEAQIRKSIEATGILLTAESNAGLFIGNLLRQMGYEKVNIGYGPAPVRNPTLN